MDIMSYIPAGISAVGFILLLAGANNKYNLLISGIITMIIGIILEFIF